MNKTIEDLKPVLTLALEALEQYEKAGLSTLKTIDAIVSLRETLAHAPSEREQSAQEDPCPGCRKGVVCRTPKCGRLKLPVDHPLRSEQPAQPKRCQCPACKIAPHASDCPVHNEPAWPNGPCDCGAQPEQEPVAYWHSEFLKHNTTSEQPAPAPEVREQQEPVAWTVAGKVTDWSRDFGAYKTPLYVRPVYTSPQPTQPWVGLTDEERQELFVVNQTQWEVMRKVEAKLREKNAHPSKPLTDEQIMEMYNEPRSDAEMIAFARAIEAKLNEKNGGGV